MKRESYIWITDKIREFKYGEKIIIIANNVLTGFVYLSYFLLLLFLILHKNSSVIRVVLVTGISFVTVSIIRHLVNAKRPYTKYNFKPVIEKDKEGDSMPSRHVFSAFVIGIAFLYFNTLLGIVVLIDGVFMCFGRVIAGVHFPRDVIAGAIIGITAGVIGFYLV